MKKKYNVEINEFLRTGIVGSVQVGISIAEFLRICEVNGEDPELYSQDDLVLFYDYRDFDLAFYEGVLNTISANMSLRWWVRFVLYSGNKENKIDKRTPMNRFVYMLEDSGIKWWFHRIESEKNIYIRTEGGVEVSFSFLDKEEELCNMSRNRILWA